MDLKNNYDIFPLFSFETGGTWRDDLSVLARNLTLKSFVTMLDNFGYDSFFIGYPYLLPISGANWDDTFEDFTRASNVLSADFWCNGRGESFLCITGHWLTDDINSVSKIIDFSVFNHRHTAIDIARIVKEKLVALDIYEKIICITCDGAENMVLACYFLNDDIPRIWCYGHRLHLVVINGLGFWLTEDTIDNRVNPWRPNHFFGKSIFLIFYFPKMRVVARKHF
jgi:hypothetical protein